MTLLQKFTPKSDFSQRKTERILSTYFSSLRELGSIIPDHAYELEREIIQNEVSDWSHIKLDEHYKHRNDDIPDEVLEKYSSLEDKLGQQLLQREDKKEIISVLGELITGFKNGSIITEDDKRNYHHLKELLRTAQIEEGFSYKWVTTVDFGKVSDAAERAIKIAESYIIEPISGMSNEDIKNLNRLSKSFKKVKGKADSRDKRKACYDGELRLGLITDSMFEGAYSYEREPSLIERVQTGIARKRLESTFSCYGFQKQGFDIEPKEGAESVLGYLSNADIQPEQSLIREINGFVRELSKVNEQNWDIKKPGIVYIGYAIDRIIDDCDCTSTTELKAHFKEMRKTVAERRKADFKVNLEYFTGLAQPFMA